MDKNTKLICIGLVDKTIFIQNYKLNHRKEEKKKWSNKIRKFSFPKNPMQQFLFAADSCTPKRY